MTLGEILKNVGKDLKDVAGWIDDGLKIAEPIVGVFDPPLGPLFTAIEAVLSSLLQQAGSTGPNCTQAITAVTARQVQLVVTDVATLHAKLLGKKAA